MKSETLGQVQLNGVAPGRKDLLGDPGHQRMLNKLSKPLREQYETTFVRTMVDADVFDLVPDAPPF